MGIIEERENILTQLFLSPVTPHHRAP